MLVSDFDYALPADLIAQFPTPERRASRLLEVADSLTDRHFADLPGLLRAGDLLVFNDTRVIRARLHAQKETGGRAEVLIERQRDECSALAHVRASKSPKPGSRLLFAGGAEALVESRDGEFFSLLFSVPLMPLLETCGEVPLPPYLNRPAESADDERYQTVYAKDPGAVAAPTAGLHFDDAMLAETLSAGVRHAYVTLHVGAGTFQALQSAACNGELEPFNGETDLFILPGYKFRTIDALLTNFHLPQSSLLMLVAAFAGTERILNAYKHAVRQQYRFFSYGDAMLLYPETRQ
jgi:S-adenosylmethionine:tRNA ribosyltransferase-isomerase